MRSLTLLARTLRRRTPAAVRPSGARRLRGFAVIAMIAGLIVFMMAIIGLAVGMTGLLDTVYMELSLTLPKFDYRIEGGQESGNEIFDAYAQMRLVAAGIMVMALTWAGLSRVFESADESGLARRGTSNKIISHSVMFVLFLIVFPPLWDGSSEVVENVSLWILNPNYSFETENNEMWPCPADWDLQRVADEWRSSNYTKGLKTGDVSFETAKIVCEPRLKVNYVFSQMVGWTEVSSIKQKYADPTAPFGDLMADLENFKDEAFTNLFLGLSKALMTINLLLMAFVIGTMADVLVGMLMASIPVFLFLSLIPKFDSVANRFIDALPALLLLPILSATVIAVGAGFIVTIADGGGDVCNAESVEEAERMYLEGDRSCRPADTFDDGTMQIIYVWISSLGVVFLGVMLPVMLVPMLGSVTQQATQAITSAVSTGAMVTGMGAAGMARGAASGMQAAKAGGGLSSLSGLGRMLGHVGAGAVGGMAAGHMGAKTGGMGGVEPGQLFGGVEAGLGKMGHMMPHAPQADPNAGGKEELFKDGVYQGGGGPPIQRKQGGAPSQPGGRGPAMPSDSKGVFSGTSQDAVKGAENPDFEAGLSPINAKLDAIGSKVAAGQAAFLAQHGATGSAVGPQEAGAPPPADLSETVRNVEVPSGDAVSTGGVPPFEGGAPPEPAVSAEQAVEQNFRQMFGDRESLGPMGGMGPQSGYGAAGPGQNAGDDDSNPRQLT